MHLDPEIARRYLAGEKVGVLAAELGVAASTLSMRFGRAGVRRPRRRLPIPLCPRCGGPASSTRVVACARCVPRHPKPGPRTCALDGCDVVFTPEARKVADGGGRYCSLPHAYAARRGFVPPQFRRG